MDPVSRIQSGNNQESRLSRFGDKIQMWKPGQSGNPSGRPKKKPITELFEQLFEASESNESIKKQMLKTLTSRGMAGVLLLREAAERIEGKVTQEVEMNVNAHIALAGVIEERRKKRGNGS